MQKYFVITVDTEGDNLWKPVQSRTGLRNITVRNSEFVEKFQEVCESYQFIPTYLVNYEMSQAEAFIKMAQAGLKNDTLEVGMHMHAWNCPPLKQLQWHKDSNNPYAGEYPVKVLNEKIHYLTGILQDTFQSPITSHRGGRWYIDNAYMEMLNKEGYLVDCTVTPGISWEKHIGNSVGGCDFKKFPKGVYKLALSGSKGKKAASMLEIPPTLLKAPLYNFNNSILDNIKNFSDNMKKVIWLRPNGNNLKDILYLIEHSRKVELPYLEFMIHSSELMPGGSPTFRNEKDIKKLYYDLDIIFKEISKSYKGISLSGLAKLYRKRKTDIVDLEHYFR